MKVDAARLTASASLPHLGARDVVERDDLGPMLTGHDGPFAGDDSSGDWFAP